MTPSKQAKAIGLKSIKQVSDISTFKVRNLFDMAKNSPVKFEIVLLGCKEKLKEEEDV